MYPKIFDIYNHCSDELKKSLDHGREFESKLRSVEDNAKLEGKLKKEKQYDKEMKGEDEETKEEREENKLVGEARKKQ